MEYIADKKVYASVMFAKKLLAQGNEFTDAVGIASHYYNVAFEETRKYLAQCRKHTNNNKGIKYKYYIKGEFHTWDNEDAGGQRFDEKASIKKAKQGTTNYTNNTHIFNKEFDTEKEAKEFLTNNNETIMNYFRQFQWG